MEFKEHEQAPNDRVSKLPDDVLALIKSSLDIISLVRFHETNRERSNQLPRLSLQRTLQKLGEQSERVLEFDDIDDVRLRRMAELNHSRQLLKIMTFAERFFGKAQ